MGWVTPDAEHEASTTAKVTPERSSSSVGVCGARAAKPQRLRLLRKRRAEEDGGPGDLVGDARADRSGIATQGRERQDVVDQREGEGRPWNRPNPDSGQGQGVIIGELEHELCPQLEALTALFELAHPHSQ